MTIIYNRDSQWWHTTKTIYIVCNADESDNDDSLDDDDDDDNNDDDDDDDDFGDDSFGGYVSGGNNQNSIYNRSAYSNNIDYLKAKVAPPMLFIACDKICMLQKSGKFMNDGQNIFIYL